MANKSLFRKLFNNLLDNWFAISIDQQTNAQQTSFTFKIYFFPFFGELEIKIRN